MSAGFYSVIQFRLDPLREERVNVGLVLGARGGEVLHVRMTEDTSRLRKLFGKHSIDEGRLASAMKAFENRLVLTDPTEEGLRDFGERQAGQLVLGKLRASIVENPAADLERLFAAAVAVERKQRQSKARKPDLETHFRRLDLNPAVRRDVSVEVPYLGKPLRADYAYKNGVDNFVKGHGFSKEKDAAAEQAMRLGSQGRLLNAHPNKDGRNQKLIVVGECADPENVTVHAPRIAERKGDRRADPIVI